MPCNGMLNAQETDVIATAIHQTAAELSNRPITYLVLYPKRAKNPILYVSTKSHYICVLFVKCIGTRVLS